MRLTEGDVGCHRSGEELPLGVQGGDGLRLAILLPDELTRAVGVEYEGISGEAKGHMRWGMHERIITEVLQTKTSVSDRLSHEMASAMPGGDFAVSEPGRGSEAIELRLAVACAPTLRH